MTEKERLEADNAVRSLTVSADNIMRVDGDRGHMNRSDLTCEHTQIAARLMREVAGWIETIRL